MQKLPYNILTISKDPTLAMANPSFGDAQKRNLEYGRFVKAIYSVTYSSKNLNLENKKISENVFVFPTNSLNQLFFLCNAWRIAKKICRDNKIDLVLTQDPFLTGLVGWWVKRRFGCKLLVHFHGDYWQNQNFLAEKWFNRLLLILSKFVAKKVDAFRVVSQGIKTKLIKEGIVEKKVYVISTPVEVEKFLTAAVDTNAAEVKTDKKILFVGRLEKEKNLAWFLEVFKQIKQEFTNVKFVIIGDGGEKTVLESMAKKLRLENSVVFAGAVAHDELSKYYHEADIFVLPSLSESFGKVLVEAGAAGVPAVASATTGAKEIIQDNQTGFLVPINDAVAMKEKILLLLKDDSLQQKMGLKAQEYVQENFDARKQTEKIIAMWQKIIDG